MISKLDRERQFNTILDAADGDRDALLAAARQIERHDAEISADLRLSALLPATMPTKAEIDSARLRVGQRLTHDIFADPDAEGTPKHALRPLRLSEPPETILDPVASAHSTTSTLAPIVAAPRMAVRAIWQTRRRRVLTAAAAVAALILALGAGLIMASAQSLPESPLYGVKRAEESILLALPLGDNARAQVLGMAALRRLEEAQAEANAHHDAEATALLSQYNDDMRQLIMLAASINRQNGDSSDIIGQIAQILQTQQRIQQFADARGDARFSLALKNSAATVTATLKAQGVTLPDTNGAAGQKNGKDHSVATATPIIGPTPTAPGSSGSHGHGHGHGHGSGGNTDH